MLMILDSSPAAIWASPRQQSTFQPRQAASKRRRRFEQPVAGGAGGLPALISPHDKEAMAMLVTNQDLNTQHETLMRSAEWARRLARIHRFAARECIKTARAAYRVGDRVRYQEYLNEAKTERRQSVECMQFARLCEESIVERTDLRRRA
jgi:hypothetical protein